MTVAQKESQKLAKVRIQLDLLEHQAEIFDAMKDECGLETRKELFNVAMTLFNWAVKETRNGRKISSYDPVTDDVETVIMPALEFLKQRSSAKHNVSSYDRSPSSLKKPGSFSVV